MQYPNFIIIGAPKAGTTALYHYLKQHPNIFMSSIKEPNFFSLYGKQLCFQGPLDDVRTNHLETTTIRGYQKLFESALKQKIAGEASTSYLMSPEAAHNIKQYVPHAKLIAVLRNPADRAFSEFQFCRRDGYEPCETFEKALEAEAKGERDNWWAGHYLRDGFYYDAIQRYYNLFGWEQFQVYLYDDVVKDMAGVLKDIFHFLGIDENVRIDTKTKHNVSGEHGSKSLHAVHNFFARPNKFKSLLIKPFFPDAMRRKIRNAILNRIRNFNLQRKEIDPKIKRKLMEEYRGDILKLQELLGRDLSHWLKC